MEHPGVSEETLKRAKRMKAELLIQTNKMRIIKRVKLCHNVNLTLDTTITSMQTIHVHLHLQHAATSDVLNTMWCIDPDTDILQQLDNYIHEEIEQLYDYILHTLGNHHVVCYICGQPMHCA